MPGTTSPVSVKPDLDPVSPFELVDRPYAYVGIGKSSWARLRAEGNTPPPVKVPGMSRPFYRKSDLDAWLRDLPVCQ